MRSILKTLFISFIIVIGFAIVLKFGVEFVSAAEFTIYEQTLEGNTDGCGTGRAPDTQTFYLESGTYITRIELKTSVTGSYPSYDLETKLCAGENCTGTVYNTLIRTQTGISTSTADWADFSPLEPVYVPAGTSTFQYDCESIGYPTTTWSFRYNSTNQERGAFNGNELNDLTLKIYGDNDYIEDEAEIIEIPEWEGEVGIEAEYELMFMDINYCTIGYTCLLWFDYNSEVLDKEIHLTYDTSDERYDYGNSVDVVYPIDTLIKQDYFNIPATTTPTTEEFCITALDPDNYASSTIYCGIKVIWVQESTILDDLFGEYDCDTICDDISTSSDTFLEGVKNGLECAFRKVVCWSFVPSEASLIKFAGAVYQMENTFPFSIYKQVEREIKAVEFTDSDLTFDINFGSLMGIAEFDNDIVLASSTQMEDTFGGFWTIVYDIMEKMVYFGIFIFIVFRLLKLARK